MRSRSSSTGVGKKNSKTQAIVVTAIAIRQGSGASLIAFEPELSGGFPKKALNGIGSK